MSDFEKLINASDLIEWIIETDPDWCVGSVRSIIDHIDKMPSVQPETHDKRTKTHTCDYINRKDAIDAHYEYCNKHPDAGFPVWSLKILENLPSAQPDLSEYSDKLWKAAYERGKAEALDEIIHCKDCKHSRFFDPCFYCYEFGEEINVPENGFCFMAERRTNDGE